MRQFPIILLCTALYLFGCQSDQNLEVEEMHDSRPFPVLIDTLLLVRQLPFSEANHPTWLSFSDYKIYFIGYVSDTLYLGSPINFTSPPVERLLSSDATSETRTKKPERYSSFRKYYLQWHELRAYKNWAKAKIDIQINTSTKISGSFPVIITNGEMDTILIANQSGIPLIMEARDSLGNWRPIQEEFIYMCGNSVSSFILPPNESALTLAPIFKGNYTTKLRLRLGENLSEPFVGSIHYRQFQSKFDEHGEFKEVYLREREEQKMRKP